MKLYKPTPMARRQLDRTPALAIAIDMAEPRDALVSFGYSGGWTARILTPDLRLLGEAYHKADPPRAFDAALVDMEKGERDVA